MTWGGMRDGGRRSIRLRGHDYGGGGWYFVTVCTYQKRHTLARAQNGHIVRTSLGEIVQECWHSLPNHYRVELDEFVVMTHHIHGIVYIPQPDDLGNGIALSDVVGSFKSAATRRAHREIPGSYPVWHRNFHERIIRDHASLNAARRYIANNPAAWLRAHS